MRPLRVMLADDHAVLRAGLRLLIDGQPDMKVVAEAADGPEAVRKARQAHPDVVVLDLTMPRTDPLAVIWELSSISPRVVVLSMHEDPAYVESALAAGADGYVPKRVADTELLTAIRVVGSGRSFVDSCGVRTRPRTPSPRVRHALSIREMQVVRLVGHGFTNREIADRLNVGVKSVETFRARACEKAGLGSRADLVRFALDLGLLGPEDGERDGWRADGRGALGTRRGKSTRLLSGKD